MSEAQTAFTGCSLQAYLPSRDITVINITSVKRLWDRTWEIYGTDGRDNTTGAFRDKDIMISLPIEDRLPDTYRSQASLKMAFLQDMLESENVGMIEIEEAFEQAKEEYRKTIEED